MSFWTPFKTLTRIGSFVGKEILETIRRPAALVSLVVGPFLIMALFGVGYSGVRRPLDTVLVIPQSSGLREDPAYWQNIAGPVFHIVGVEQNAAGAEQKLREQQLDVVVVAPANGQQEVAAGRQATVKVEYNVVDPILNYYVGVAAQGLEQEINKQITTQAVTKAEQQVQSPQKVPPEVVAEPTKVETVNVAPTPPGVITFFGPAVFALILQHLAVTLTALSLVRERLSGALELFRISPVSPLEILIGKYIAYGLFNAVVSAIVVAVLVTAFHVPLLGSITAFVAVLALLTFASLGVGLLISVVSDSERQAVQLALLLLLASVFFSGFVLPVDEFIPWVRTLAYVLPVTHGIRLIQDLMIRGQTVAMWEASVLAAIGVICFFATLVFLRRSLGSR